MKINEIIQEAKFRTPIMVYHGTSSVFLRTILKNGIMPNPKEKVWADDPESNINSPSRASIGGSYWTSDLDIAMRSAERTTEKFNGNMLLIVAQVSEGSSLADEDSLVGFVDRAYKYAVTSVIGKIPPSDIDVYAYSFLENPVFKKNFLEKFSNYFHQTGIEDPSKLPINMPLLEKVCMALFYRFVAYTLAGKGSISLDDKSVSTQQFMGYLRRRLGKITVPAAESNYHRWIDKLTRYYRQPAYKTPNSIVHTLRTEKVVGFSGANKILYIYEIDENENLLQRYGKKFVPPQFGLDWAHYTGNTPTILRNGNKNNTVQESVHTPIFQSDIPNEDWLNDAVSYAKEKGKDRFGVPYMGKWTGNFVGGLPKVPVNILKRLKGMRGEQENVRHADLAAIKKIMQDTGKLPLINGKEYAPFVMVAWDGSAWVNEGNHRIMAAAELGWDSLPVEIRYFDGGERMSGPLEPKKIIQKMRST